MAAGQPLHEVRLPLVLAGARGLARPPLAGEGHVPALVLGVLQSRVVVLQHDLREDAVPTVTLFLGGADRYTEKEQNMSEFLSRGEGGK